MHVHLIGVCGTGMGALAGLLTKAGHRVTGSDTAFHPPIGPALARWGVETMPGWNPDNLVPAPDLVVVGNVCRRDNPEARAAIDGGLRYASFPETLETLFLTERPGYVVAGTHGKTTTTSLVAYLLHDLGLDPGFLVGGIPRNFDVAFRVGGDAAPFVVEGDEYDTAFFEKKPKFWRYRPWAVVLTSVEHDHIDIYPDPASYRAAFVEFIRRIPEDGVLIAWAGDPEVRAIAKEAKCRLRFYGLIDDDCGDVAPLWQAAPGAPLSGATPFELFGGGTFCGRVVSPMSGAHNMRNALAALALVTEGAGAPLADAIDSLARFEGIRRRQELLGVVDGVRVYDDFAHHPTAVLETLRGLRRRHPEGKLIAAFEPRSATASRNLHQARYPGSFAAADLALLAPVGRKEIGEDERLDVAAIAAAICDGGGVAEAPGSIEGVVARIVSVAEPGDSVVLMSNGTFGGAHDAVLLGLTETMLERETR